MPPPSPSEASDRVRAAEPSPAGPSAPGLPGGGARWLGPLLTLGLLAPLAREWLAGRTLSYGDSKAFYAPLRHLVGEALRAGHLPLWNPYNATGVPLYAEGIHGVLHPISLATAFLFRGDGIDPLFGGYVVSAGLGAWVLARILGCSWTAALVAGLSFGLSGVTLSMTGNLVFLAGAGSLPWAIAGAVVAAERDTHGGLAIAALGTALLAFSGDFQGLVVGSTLGLVLALSRGWRGLLRAAGGVALGGALAAVQLLPTWIHLGRTLRASGISAADSIRWALVPARALELLLPGLVTHPADMTIDPIHMALDGAGGATFPFAASVFVGAVALALALCAPFAERRVKTLAIASLVLLWLALGHRAGATQLLRLLPLVGSFRYSEKYVVALTLCITLLAALGAERASASRRLGAIVGTAASGALLLFLAFWLASSSRSAPELLERLGVPLPELVAQHLSEGLAHVVGAMTLLGVGAVLSWKAHGRAALASWAAAAFLASFAAAPFALRPGLPECRDGVPPPELSAPPPGPRVQNPAFVAGRPPAPGRDRLDQASLDGAAIVSPNYNAAQRVDNVGLFSALTPTRRGLVLSTFGADWPLASRRFSVTHVIVPPGTSGTSVEGATRGARLAALEPRTGAEIWEVPHRPWAGFASAVVSAEDASSAAALLRSAFERGDPATIVEHAPLPTAPGRVLAVDRGTERISVLAESAGDAVLVVNDAVWPGWRATIDGVEAEVFPADVLVRALAWPAGRHRLDMVYAPPEVLIGASITFATAFLLLAPWGLRSWRRRRPRRAGPSADRLLRSPNFRDGSFRNRAETPVMLAGGFLGVLEDLIATRGGTPRRAIQGVALRRDAFSSPPTDDVVVTWLGHSTALLELEGQRLLLDPMWSHRSSPSRVIGPARFVPPPLPLDELPALSAVLVSHDHYDHLDRRTIERLARTDPRLPFVVPLGVGGRLEAWGVEPARIVELDWWEETALGGGLRVVSTPARHFSGRGPFDRNATLWTSWALLGRTRRVFFGGDGGFDPAFAEIGQRLGPFDLTMLEIGAWHRSWPHIHLGPLDALAAHAALGGRRLLPIHWGMFKLAPQRWDEPIETLVTRAEAVGAALLVPRPGERVALSAPPPLDPWWRG